jgi:hypothetical protein
MDNPNSVKSKTVKGIISMATVAVSLYSSGAAAENGQSSDTDESFLSRFTVDVPFYTRHVPDDAAFNDHNWGAWVEFSLEKQWSLVGGYFINSYYRNTAVLGIEWLPINLEFSKVKIDMGGIVGMDLNGGYYGFNCVEPLLGAFSVKIGGTNFQDAQYVFLNRLGIAITLIPPAGSGGNAPINLSLAYRL